MGFEERCDRDAEDMLPQLDLLAMAARSGSWEPTQDKAFTFMMVCIDLAAALAQYCRPLTKE